MKGLRIIEDELSCIIEDAILKETSFLQITGNPKNGFTVNPPQKIEKIMQNGWNQLYPSLQDSNKDYLAIAGETN